MIRYHFNIRDGTYIPDIEGSILPTLGHAQREAIRLAGYTLMTGPGKFWSGDEWFVEVTLDDGTMIFRVKFQAENLLREASSPGEVGRSRTIHFGSEP